MSGAFSLYAGLCFVTFGFVWLWVPETKGLSLEEIQSTWKPETKGELSRYIIAA